MFLYSKAWASSKVSANFPSPLPQTTPIFGRKEVLAAIQLNASTYLLSAYKNLRVLFNSNSLNSRRRFSPSLFFQEKEEEGFKDEVDDDEVFLFLFLASKWQTIERRREGGRGGRGGGKASVTTTIKAFFCIVDGRDDGST